MSHKWSLATPILWAFLLSSTAVTCLTQLILLDLITLIIYGKLYNKLLSSLLCSSLQPHATSSLLGPSNLLSEYLLSSTSPGQCSLAGHYETWTVWLQRSCVSGKYRAPGIEMDLNTISFALFWHPYAFNSPRQTLASSRGRDTWTEGKEFTHSWWSDFLREVHRCWWK
jgi:hypothetical protein